MNPATLFIARQPCLAALAHLMVLIIACPVCSPAFGQIVTTVGNAPGVYVETDGTLKRREIDQHDELNAMRARMVASVGAGKKEKFTGVSLPRAFAAARQAIAAGKPIPDDIKYLGGLTQIRNLFIYPDSNDLMIAGPAEPVVVVDAYHAKGKVTGRPVLRLEDLVVAMRVVHDVGHGAFGCRLDPDPAAPARVHTVVQDMANASMPDRIAAVAKAIGPQKISYFGKVPDDTRFALILIAADYELKRYALGLASTTVPDLGSTIDNTRAAVNMVWYSLAYDPILVSKDGDAYGLRGPRLKVEAGSFDWDPKGATPKAFRFATKMSKSMEVLAINQPLIAELQNLADLSVVSALIQRDKLDKKVNWDTAWFRHDSGDGHPFPLTSVTTPRTADPLATYINGSMAGGGVVMSPGQLLTAPTETDTKELMAPLKLQAALKSAETPAR